MRSARTFAGVRHAGLLGIALLGAALLGSALLGGCAPPRARGKKAQAGAAAAKTGEPAPQVRESVPAAAPDERPGAGDENAAARAAAGAATPRSVVFEQLRGGVFTPRCPECGETQPTGSTHCGGCGQELAPWRRETVCPQCGGSGSCLHCGDDRPCLTCDASGRCANCDGVGSVDGRRCPECSGRGTCADCGGDGARSSASADFAPGASHLPGICTTCLYGSGLCPTCGDGAEDCPTCSGDGLCPDCRGSGACPYDRGDGLCATCDGTGREVVNGPRGTPADRHWNVRRENGAILAGRIPYAPGPDLTVMVRDGRKSIAMTLVPDKVDAISYYMAARDFTALDDADGRVTLAEIALERGLLPLARRELQRAADLDAGRARRLAGRRKRVETLRVQSWMDEARAAQAQGDRERAALLYHMVIAGSPGENDAARVALTDLRRAEADEEAARDDATRARRTKARDARVARTVTRAARRLALAERRLAAAGDATRGAENARFSFAAAEHAALQAAELIRADAWRTPPPTTPWPRPPRALLDAAQRMRAVITLAQAVEEVAGGRFAVGRTLALRARALAPEVEAESDVVAEAERGMMRRGVRLTTPPPARDADEE